MAKLIISVVPKRRLGMRPAKRCFASLTPLPILNSFRRFGFAKQILGTTKNEFGVESRTMTMTDSIAVQRRPRGWGGMFDAPPSGNEVRFCDDGVDIFGDDGAAVFGNDDKEEFRYALARCWDHNLPLWLWVMLNPSTATERENDGTIVRCLNFTRRLSEHPPEQPAGGLVAVNLFAYRTKNPKDICLSSNRHVGANNDEWIRLILKSGRISRIIAAWGKDGHFTFTDRRRAVVRLLHEETEKERIPFSQIGDSTRDGAPRHPSRCPDASPLCPYRE